MKTFRGASTKLVIVNSLKLQFKEKQSKIVTTIIWPYAVSHD